MSTTLPDIGLTATDQFCGAGGSSLGAAIAGVRLRLGLNHSKLAIETHNTNFPEADHDCTDISACDPRRYPSTDLLITSPECTNHSLAKGARRRSPQEANLFEEPVNDELAERSRATMWDVVRFTEFHGYKAIIVENVVDAYWWGPNDNGALFQSWLSAMHALGYRHRLVFLNSMFAPPTPQSRDRMYVVFWRQGQLAPDLDFTAAGWCPRCERIVEGRQAWKTTDKCSPASPWGKYADQYVYACPDCAKQIVPGAFPAATAIDWTLAGDRIGDRKRPLAKGTRDRIRRGLERYGLVPAQVRTAGAAYGADPKPLTTPFLTQTGRCDLGLLVPVAANRFERTPGSRVDVANERPFRTVHGTLDRALVVPLRNHGIAEDVELAALPTVCASGNHALVIGKSAGGVGRSIGEPMQTVTTIPQLYLADVEAFLMRYYSNGEAKPVDDPLGTVTTRDRFGLVDVEAAIDDCTFRMLQPHEIARAMVMHLHADGSEYVVLGNKREKVAQYGNAVTPPVMRMLVERIAASLEPAGLARAA